MAAAASLTPRAWLTLTWRTGRPGPAVRPIKLPADLADLGRWPTTTTQPVSPLEPGDPAPARRHLECEARAARELAGRTQFPTPEPVAVGEPGAGYPLAWLVQTWLPGVTATEEDPGGSAAFAHDLAEFIGGVRAISTRGQAFSGSGRRGDLASHDAWMQACLARSGQLLDVPVLRRMWTTSGNCRAAGAGRNVPQ